MNRVTFTKFAAGDLLILTNSHKCLAISSAEAYDFYVDERITIPVTAKSLEKVTFLADDRTVVMEFEGKYYIVETSTNSTCIGLNDGLPFSDFEEGLINIVKGWITIERMD